MATVIQGRPSQGRQNTAAIGSALGTVLEGAWKGYAQHHDQQAIQNAVASLPQDATPRQILDAVTNTRTYNPEAKQQALVNYLGGAKQEEAKRHAQATEEIARTRPQGTRASTMTPEAQEKVSEALTEQGFTPAQITQYLSSPPGVQGMINKEVAQARERGVIPGGKEEPVEEPKVARAEAAVSEWPALPGPKGLALPAQDKWKIDNEKFNRTEHKKIRESLDAAKESVASLGELVEIEKGGKLPTDWEKAITVDKETGEIRPIVKLLGKQHHDVDRWQKIINGYIKNARAIYGANVSNANMRHFMSTLPSLMNTQAGRRAIIENLRLSSQLTEKKGELWNEAFKRYPDKRFSDIAAIVDRKMEAPARALALRNKTLPRAADRWSEEAKNPAISKGKTLMYDQNGDAAWVPDARVGEGLEHGSLVW